jgi:hypothetical protein
MVQWTDGKGEIERQVDADTNDNGLREQFIDVIPYAPFFQQFLALVPRLTLTQAKKIDVDLIRQIYESKRQAPFHYPIAAGDYWWDATDESLLSSVVPSLQNAIAKINEIVAQLNSFVPQLTAKDQAISDAGNALIAQLDGYVINPLKAFILHYDDTVLGIWDGVNTAPNTINARLQSIAVTGGTDIVGLAGQIAHYGGTLTNPWSVFPASGMTWPPVANVAVPAVQWIPIGATAPVSVTPAEQAAILSGIAARSNALNVKKNTKIGQVNALTTIEAVIAYDVTTGW